jgi:uncharacterized protein RhaS with RHS repeats
MMARYYSSSLGRFMAVDPGDDTSLADPQSWNKYSYVRNNPVNGSDPTGTSVYAAPYKAPQIPSARQIGAAFHGFASTTGYTAKALGIVGIGLLFVPGMQSVAADVLTSAGATAAGATLTQSGATILDPSDENKSELWRAGIAILEAAAVDACFDIAAPNPNSSEKAAATAASEMVGDLVDEGATGAAVCTAADEQPQESRPLVITTKEAEETP